MTNINHKNKKTVAIVTPLYNQILTQDEKISFKHLLNYLGSHDKYLIVPGSLDVKNLPKECKDFLIKKFDQKYFKSRQSYSKLLLTKKFYKSFNDYDYILMYQPDCLVFFDKLSYWCDQGYDYIGAPWYKTKILEVLRGDGQVGNGGFSLRRVEGFLKVLDVYQSPLNIIKRKLIDYYKKGSRDYQKNEDLFWSFKAKQYYPEFKIAPSQVAVSFSFETSPQYCFEKNNQILPFGCHAWAKYNRQFWEPYLLK